MPAEPTLASEIPRFVMPVLLTILVGALTWIAVPVFVKLVHHFFAREPERATDTVIEALATKSGKVRLKALMEDIFEYELQEREQRIATNEGRTDRAIGIAEANHDRLEQIDLTTKTHSMELKAITGSLVEVPRMGEALDRISKSIESFATEMRGVHDFMSRSDERERIRTEERRLGQSNPHPNRRMGE